MPWSPAPKPLGIFLIVVKKLERFKKEGVEGGRGRGGLFIRQVGRGIGVC